MRSILGLTPLHVVYVWKGLNYNEDIFRVIDVNGFFENLLGTLY